MKEETKVALVQFRPEWLQPDRNAERMVELSKNEAENGAELIVFPECANIGYITPLLPGEKPSFNSRTTAAEFRVKYGLAAEPIPGPTSEALSEVASKYGVYIVVGIAQIHPSISDILYNSAALIGPSGLIGIHHKAHLAANEKSFFYPGSTADVYDTDLGKLGMVICYDGRFPELPRVLSLKGAEIICHLAATPIIGTYTLLPGMHLRRACQRAEENANYYLCCNRTGTEGSLTYFGHSAIGGPSGNVVAYCESDKEEVLTATLSNKYILQCRAMMNPFYDRRPDMYSAITEPVSPLIKTRRRPSDAALP